MRKVVLATGISDRSPDLPHLTALRKAGVLRYCSVCDGYEHQGREVIVLADSKAGFEKALFIKNWTSKINLAIPRSKHFSPKQISYLLESGLKIVRYDSLKVAPLRHHGALSIKIDGIDHRCSAIYVELGSDVNLQATLRLNGIKRSLEKFILASAEQRTSIAGLYAVGDCVNRLGQISTAIGQAAVATNNIHDELLKLNPS